MKLNTTKMFGYQFLIILKCYQFQFTMLQSIIIKLKVGQCPGCLKRFQSEQDVHNIKELRKYFHIQDDKNVEVSLLSKQQVKCSNLLLKVQQINKPNKLFHVKYCSIGSLQVSFNRKKSQAKKPLNVILDRVKVIMKFNQFPQKADPNKQQKKKERPLVDEFIKAVSTEDVYKHRNFIQQQIFQLTKLIAQYALQQIYIKITNIDFAIQYLQKPKFFGLQIQEIQAHQQFTSLEATNYSNNYRPQSSHLLCQIKNLSSYFGAQYEIEGISNQNQMKKLKKMKKIYILQKTSLSVSYNLQKHFLSISSEQIIFDFEDIFITQLMKFVKFSSSKFNDKPRLSPREGPKVEIPKITSQNFLLDSRTQKRMEISEGTLQWWKYIGGKVIEKLNRQINSNILRSMKFRKYLFSLLYRYTYGAHHKLQQMIDQYQAFKSDMQVMVDNKIIIQKIHNIRQSSRVSSEDQFFVNFITSVEGLQEFKVLGLRKLTVKDIKKSNIIVNYENCVRFINEQEMQGANSITIKVNLNRFIFNMIKPKLFQIMRNDLQLQTPETYFVQKNRILDYYCNKSIIKADEYFEMDQNLKQNLQSKEKLENKSSQMQIKPYAQLIISAIRLDFNSGQGLNLEIPSIQMSDQETNTKIMSLSRLKLIYENMKPQAYSWKIVADKRMSLDLEMGFIEANSKFVEQILTVISYLKEPEMQDKAQNKNFISQFISKKVPVSPIFNSYKNTSLDIYIKSVIISTSAFHKGKNFQLNIKGISYNDPINGKSSFGTDQFFILRSTTQNTHKKVAGQQRSKKNNDENVILTTIRPLSGFLDKSIEPQLIDITEIVIPFILIQLSCQDVYYAFNIKNVWQKIMQNQYYFPKKKKRQKRYSQINPYAASFAKELQKKMRQKKTNEKQVNKNPFLKNIVKQVTNIFKFKLEGIQISLISDYLNEQNNRIMDLLIDDLTIKTQSNYTTDQLDIQLRDIFIRNCLSFKGVNKESLITSIKNQLQFGDQPILFEKKQHDFSSQKRNAKMARDRQLLLFTDSSFKGYQNSPFLSFSIQSIVHLQNYVSITTTKLDIVPIYLFYSTQFTDAIRSILSTIHGLSIQNIYTYELMFKKDNFGLPFSSFQGQNNGTGATTTDVIDIKEVYEQPQILAASQFQQINVITGSIKKLNLLAVKNASVVYTISLFDINFRHRSEPYLQRFFFTSNGLIIVDTSEQAGPQPIIIDISNQQKGSSPPLKGSFTTYKSEIMKFRQKKSAFFHLQIQGLQIKFLKKKVLELVNFLPILLTQAGVLSPPGQQTKSTKQPNQFPLRYKIQIIKPTLKLFRSSLSIQGFKSIINSIKVANFIEEELPEGQKSPKKDQNLSNSVSMSYADDANTELFQQFNNSKQGNIQFASFQQLQGENGNKKQAVVQKIYINVNGLYIFGSQFWNKNYRQLFRKVAENNENCEYFLAMENIFIEFFSPQMVMKIPNLQGNMKDEDFRILMRMTEQNLSQSPLLFVMPPNPQTVNKISFLTSFLVQHLAFSVLIEQKNISNSAQTFQNKITLQLDYLSGKNQMWTSNQNSTQLTIQEMHLFTQNDITIMSKLDQQHFNELPDIPKDVIETDLNKIKQFYDMQQDLRKQLQNMLHNQSDQVQKIKQQNKDENGGEGDKISSDRTNTQKIYQWVKGMVKKCRKCCKCCKKNKQQDTHNQIFQAIFMNGIKNAKNQFHHRSQIFIGKNDHKNKKAPMIYKFQDILDSQYDFNEQLITTKKKLPSMVYLNFSIKPNGEKLMYMQVKKVQVLLENTKGLIGMSSFFAKPFSISDIPEHVRQYKFNNCKPFKMLIQVDDALAEMKAENQQGKIQRVSILCDLVYSNNKKGETTIGPGLSIMKVQGVAKIIFMSQTFNNTPIDLSDSFDIIYLSQNRIPYGQDKRNQNKQRVYLKALQNQDSNISFFIPAFALKSLNRIFLYNFTKVQSQDKQQAQMAKNKNKNETIEKNVSSQQVKAISIGKPASLQSNLKAIQAPQKRATLPSKKTSFGQDLNHQQKKAMQAKIEDYKKQQINKPLPPPQNPKESHMIRSLYIPQITLEIESNLQISFIKSRISQIKLSELYINNKAYKKNKRTIYSKLDVNYWNLKLGFYEPCIEPWKFKLQQDIYQRDNLSSSNFKISSYIDSWQQKGDQQYINDLNVNVSIALYQIFKQLLIVYEQENYDQNQDCINLTSIKNSDYNTLFNRNKKKQQFQALPDSQKPYSQKIDTQKTDFPSKLLKYFTRVFKTAQNQSIKNYENSRQKYFNPPTLRLYLYHSYFDHFRRKKCITYRTPYRVFNSTNVDLAFYFFNPKITNKVSKVQRQSFVRWKAIVKRFQHYAIPDEIYYNDFLVHVSDNLTMDIPQPGSPYISVKYLIQMRANKQQFKVLKTQSVIWKNIFKYSSAQTDKKIDRRDLILRVGKYMFTTINVFSKHQPKQEETGSSQSNELNFYDAYCIIQSPIIIDNYTYLDLNLKVNGTKTVKIAKNQRVEINQNFNQIVSSTIIQFQNDSLHLQRKIFDQKIDIDKPIEKVVQIQNLQSIKISINRDTFNSCLMKIYAQWNISNLTNQNFSIKNSQKLILVDKLSFNCLSNISSKGIDICIVNQEKFSKKIKPNNIIDVITLAKRKKEVQNQNFMINKRQYERKKHCGPFRSSNTIYEYIDFVINAKEDPIEPLLCQKIQFRYRYLIRNQTEHQIRLCQANRNFVIAELPKKDTKNKVKIEPNYIFYYKFLPQKYFIQINMEDQPAPVRQSANLQSANIQPNSKQKNKGIQSCQFELDKFPGSTFVVKIKKDANNEIQKYEDRFYYFRFEIKKVQEQTLIQICKADFSDFPIYIQNLTKYTIQIEQASIESPSQQQKQMLNKQIITLKPGYNLPFTWSMLDSQKYKLTASIQGLPETKQIYQFNNKSSFQPLKIIDKTNNKKLKNINNLYMKESFHVIYEYFNISTKCMVVLDRFDNRLHVHSKEQNFNYQFNMNNAQRITPLASKIQIIFDDNNKSVLEIFPPPRLIKKWIDQLQQCINVNVVDQIFFTIESYGNSRIFFFKTLQQQICQTSQQQFSIAHLNVSLISPIPQQIILLYCGNISYTQQDKLTKINHKNLQLNQSQKTITIKKLRVSNQTNDAVNPVVLSQIKKSNYPFVQLRLIQQKLQLEADVKKNLSHDEQLQEKEKQQMITHYKEVTFFMDQAEVMVEAALFLKMFGLKKSFDDVTNQYAVGQKMEKKDQEQGVNMSQGIKTVQLVNLQQFQQQNKPYKQVYINYLQIKPIKLTVSVYLQHNQNEQIQINLISILRYIPFGIENAIIEMQSYQYFHVFYNMDELKKQFIKYYTKQAWNQIYKNAGSYDMFVPIQLVGGVGNGVKQIFYDPIYELVKKKEIKAVGKTFCEGLLSFLVFLITFIFKLINLIFKVLAALTFDREFRTKRQAFRKQIFKSPVEGAMLGWKNFWSVFKSFFLNFKNISKNFSGYFIFGYILGFILCIINIIPWTIKLVVCTYDWLYVIGVGFVNWGYYEQSAMKTRSRPRRTFDHKLIIQYRYIQALGQEIIRKNQLQYIRNEKMLYIKSIESRDDINYLILSNYRIIYNYNRLIGMQIIRLYQIERVQSWYFQSKQQYVMQIGLSIPNTHKVLFLFSYAVSKYRLNFSSEQNIVTFLYKLKILCLGQNLAVKFQDGKQISKKMNNGQIIVGEILQNYVAQGKRQQQQQVNKQRNRWQKSSQKPKWAMRATTALRSGGE